MFESKILSKIFGPEREKEQKNCGNYIHELHNFCCLSDISVIRAKK
jgi:hypothetical protein